jgi:hypothetical protein
MNKFQTNGIGTGDKNKNRICRIWREGRGRPEALLHPFDGTSRL